MSKIYRFVGIDMAMQLLRPDAKWEISNGVFTRWDDPRPCPSMDEINYVMELVRDLEDKIPTIWLTEQLAELEAEHAELERALS